MKKYTTILFFTILVNLLLCSYALNGACYLTVQSTLGEQTIYIPINYVENSFCLDDNGLPINVTGSAITGYTLDDSGTRYYRITINPFGEDWAYRLNSGSAYGSTETFIVNELIESNIEFVTSDSIEGDKINYELILIGLLGMGVVICFMKT